MQILVGILYANLVEVLVHKYILHGLGKTKNSVWRFHWSDHHKTARKNKMVDSSYFIPFWKTGKRLKEVLGLALLSFVHIPLLLKFPAFVITLFVYTFGYYFAHKHSHLDEVWGKKWLRWHFDHHMLKDQDKNWGVLMPIFDYIFGTRKKR